MITFYFEQQENIVSVKIAADVSVNAWEGSVTIPKTLNVGNIITAGSIVEIWQTTPRAEGKNIVFTGGTTNGFSGDGVLFKFIVGRGNGTFTFSKDTVAYLNDGQGTQGSITTQPLTYYLAQKAVVEPRIDREPPQPFEPVLYREKEFFDGSRVLVFSARDFESGISHYEIRETTKQGIGNWRPAESPYVVYEDVTRIEVKAVDAFNNERIAVVNVTQVSWLLYTALLLGIAVTIGLFVYGMIRKKWNIHLK